MGFFLMVFAWIVFGCLWVGNGSGVAESRRRALETGYPTYLDGRGNERFAKTGERSYTMIDRASGLMFVYSQRTGEKIFCYDDYLAEQEKKKNQERGLLFYTKKYSPLSFYDYKKHLNYYIEWSKKDNKVYIESSFSEYSDPHYATPKIFSIEISTEKRYEVCSYIDYDNNTARCFKAYFKKNSCREFEDPIEIKLEEYLLLGGRSLSFAKESDKVRDKELQIKMLKLEEELFAKEKDYKKIFY